jgi:transcriptional regulator with XRE-family HTH domain
MTKSANEIDAHIGSRVKLRRMAIGMSQEQLGQALGLTFQQVQKYEKGLNRIGAGRLYRIAQVLDVPVSSFFEGLPEAGGDSSAEEIANTAELMSFLASIEGYQLSTAFSRIEDAATRRRLVDLIRTIAQVEAETGTAAE